MSTIPWANPSNSTFPIASDKNGASKFASDVSSSLVRQGMDADSAARLSLVYGSAYSYLKQNWSQIAANYTTADYLKQGYDAVSGAQKFVQASRLLQNAAGMGASSAVLTGFSNARIAGASGVLSGLVTVMQLVADHNHVQYNRCAVSIAKVSLDLVGIVGGGITVEFGVGGVLAVMSIVSATADTVELAASCKLVQ
jgi:membrane associated rhomboid family serine protease